MDNVVENWASNERWDRLEDMVRGMLPSVAFTLEDAFDTGVAYLQSWDIYMWGEPNESSLLLVNSR